MHCSIGVDISYLVSVGRKMLSDMDLVPATLQSTVNAAIVTGNNMAIPIADYVDTIKWMVEAAIIAGRLWQEMDHLQAGNLVLGECGHGTRAFRWESPNYLERGFPFPVMSSVECIAEYIRAGKIRLDPGKITEKVTLHDPCNLVRNGGVIREQQFILEQFIPDFIEMTPNGIDNHCCGGGGPYTVKDENP